MAGQRFLEDYGLTACAFCGRPRPLRLSHIIPKFVFDWLKRTSATGVLRVGYEINRPVQDGFKTRLLCQDCEQDFSSNWETPAAREVFLPMVEQEAKHVRYGPWLARFAVSVSWRVLTVFRLAGTLDAWPPPLRAEAETALRYWKEFLRDERPNPGRFEQHLLPFDFIDSTTLRDLPPNVNRYLVRAIEIDLPRSDRNGFVYSKMGPLVLFGTIRITDNVWEGTKIRMKGGTLGSEQYTMPTQLRDFMCDRARRMHEIAGDMSARQQEKVSERFRKDLDRAAGSGTMRAMEQDVKMFGDAAFVKPADPKSVKK